MARWRARGGGVAKSQAEATFYHFVCAYLVYVKGYYINIKYILIHANPARGRARAVGGVESYIARETVNVCGRIPYKRRRADHARRWTRQRRDIARETVNVCGRIPYKSRRVDHIRRWTRQSRDASSRAPSSRAAHDDGGAR